jgi:hypothetical protein
MLQLDACAFDDEKAKIKKAIVGMRRRMIGLLSMGQVAKILDSNHEQRQVKILNRVDYFILRAHSPAAPLC